MKRNYIWVVEMKSITRPHEWMPTACCGLTKHNAVACRKDFERGNPDDKFRVVMYLATREP